jgi:hypothetical protein
LRGHMSHHFPLAGPRLSRTANDWRCEPSYGLKPTTGFEPVTCCLRKDCSPSR